MPTRFTPHQVPRGTRPDAEQQNRDLLIKNVSCLRLTYQIRLLTFKAQQQQKQLVIFLPKRAKIHATLRHYMKEHSRIVRVERLD